MANLNTLNEQITKFLETDKPEVLAICGAWGVGKTFAWKNRIENEKSKVKLDRYSYVSLFGVNSLDELKSLIVTNSVLPSNLGDDSTMNEDVRKFSPILDSIIKDTANFLNKKSEEYLPNVSNAVSDLVSKTLIRNNLQKNLICIDDFERKGENLSVDDILGLISDLKEQKKCKIVLIFNDEFLQDKDVYEKYREKVIDKEIKFEPTPDECSAIVFNQDSEAISKEFCNQLKINNIRIIKKIQSISYDILPLLRDFNEKVTHQALQSLVLFTWAYYTKHDTKVPDFRFIKNEYSTQDYYMSSYLNDNKQDKEDGDVVKENWEKILKEYGYTATDQFDLTIAGIVESGWVDNDKFLDSAKITKQQFIEQASKQDFHKAWDIFHHSFDDNEQEVVDTLYNTTKRCLSYISAADVNGVVKTIRALSNADKANELIDLYLYTKKDAEDFFNSSITEIIWANGVDDVFLEKFNAIAKAKKKKRTLQEVVEKLSKSDGWSSEEENILASASADEFYNIFKNAKNNMLSSYVNNCLQFTRFSNPTENYIKIGKNCTEALQKIANESVLNKLRMRKFRIKLD
jgi:hypothetical protein